MRIQILMIDKYSYRMVVGALCCSAVAISLGALGIALKTGDIPGELTSMGLAIFGILGSLLVPSPSQPR